jgi:ankyrin repeat protein
MIMKSFWRGSHIIAAIVCSFALLESLSAQIPSKVDFARDVQPLFKQYCIGCHGPTQQMNGFRLDQRRFSMTNRVGANGARIVPGNSEGSRIYQRLVGSAAGTQMPPTGPLAEQQIAVIKAWIDQGAEWPDELSGETASSATVIPLMKAALYEDSRAVRRLLDTGADPNVKGEAGATALMWAVEDPAKVRLLLEHGADPNARSDDGRTALIMATAQFGSAAVVQLLLEHGANSSDRVPGGGPTPLSEAARAGDPAVLRLLLEHGADVKSAGTPVLVSALKTDLRGLPGSFVALDGPQDDHGCHGDAVSSSSGPKQDQTTAGPRRGYQRERCCGAHRPDVRSVFGPGAGRDGQDAHRSRSGCECQKPPE